MREIIFRGKRVDNGEWYYGYLLQPNIISNVVSGQLEYADLFVDENTVGQYTGQKDKNGKKIFEGDIVEFNHDAMGKWKGDVFWDNNDLGWNAHLKFLGKGDPLFVGECIGLGYHNSMYEVIGNIHDNPELLKQFD